MKRPIILLFIFFSILLYAQVGFGTPTPTAALEIASSNDGFLIPRVALASKDSPTILTPSVSEIVYNTVSGSDVKPGFYFWTGTSWMELDNASDTKNWRTTGNAGMTAATDFIGTPDNVDFNFKRNNMKSGILGVTNTAFGSVSLLANTAAGSTAFGANALAANTNATSNTAFGYGTLQENSFSNGMVFNNAGNVDNTAFGFEALRNNNVSSFFPNPPRAKGNTAIGALTLRSNTRGYNNTGIGPKALTSIIIGDSNTAIGPETLALNNSLSSVALGSEALRYATGGDNTALGKLSAGSNTTGFTSTVAGSHSMAKNANGGKSVAFGYKALYENVQGAEHTVAGALAMENANFSNRSTFIGYKSWGAPPSIPPIPELSSSNSVGIGSQSLSSLTSSSFNIGIGQGAEVAINTSNRVRIGNTAITYAGIQVPWTITSDRRWKSHIKSSRLGLHFIKELHPVSYTRKNDEDKKLEYGFIAQEIDQVLNKSKAANSSIVSKADDGMLSVRYNDLLAPMVKAIQQQQTVIEKLAARIKELEKNKAKK